MSLTKYYFPRGAVNFYEGSTWADKIDQIMNEKSFWNRPKLPWKQCNFNTKEKK